MAMAPEMRISYLRGEHRRIEHPVACCRKDHQNWPCDVIAGLDAAAAAERERWMAVLTEHYLMGISCDPDTKRDNAMCGCSRVHLGWHPSIGAARQSWIEHVSDVVTIAGGIHG